MVNVIDHTNVLLVRETLAGQSQLIRIDQNNVIIVNSGAQYQVLDALDLSPLKIIKSQKIGFDLLISLPGNRVIVFKNYFIELGAANHALASIENLPPLSSYDNIEPKREASDVSMFGKLTIGDAASLGGLGLALLAYSSGGGGGSTAITNSSGGGSGSTGSGGEISDSQLSNFDLVLRTFNSTLVKISNSGVSSSDRALLVNQLSDAFDLVGNNPTDAVKNQFLVDNAKTLAELATKEVLSSGSDTSESSGITIYNNNYGGSGSTGSGNTDTNTTNPAVSGFSSTSADGTYKVGDTITIKMNGSANFSVSGDTSSLKLLLNNGQYANYQSGSGSSSLTFSYVITSGDYADLLNVTSISKGSASLKDSAGTDFDLTSFTNLSENHQIYVQPAILEVSSSNPSGTYTKGETISFSVVFSDPIYVTGDASEFRLALNSGSSAIYTSGSGTSTLYFEYTLAEGDVTASLEPLALAENGVTLLSSRGQSPSSEISTSVASDFSTNHVIAIDADSPEISSITDLETSRGEKLLVTGDAYYPVSGVLTVTFNQSVLVSLGDGEQITMSLSGLFTGTDDDGDGDSYNDAALATVIDEGIDPATPRTTLSFQYSGYLRDQGDIGTPQSIEATALIKNTTTIIDESGNPALLSINAENNIAGSLSIGAGRFISDLYDVEVFQDGIGLFKESNTELSDINLSKLINYENKANVLVHITDANGSNEDYIDEYSGDLKSLDGELGSSTPIRALFSIEEILNGTANFISPITELAVRVLERDGLDLWGDDGATINTRIANALGLDGLNFENPVFTTDVDLLNHNEQEVTHAAVLAAFSTLDQFSGSIDSTLTILTPLFSIDGFNNEDEEQKAFDLISQAINAVQEGDVFLPQIDLLVKETFNKLLIQMENKSLSNNPYQEFFEENYALEVDGVLISNFMHDELKQASPAKSKSNINDDLITESDQLNPVLTTDFIIIEDHSNEETFG